MVDWYTQLDGTWEIKGTNFPMWLTDKRKIPELPIREQRKMLWNYSIW